MDELIHEKANELYEKIKKTKSKLKCAELTESLSGKNTNGYPSNLVINNTDEELFLPIKDMIIGVLRKRLAELKIEYHKL